MAAPDMLADVLRLRERSDRRVAVLDRFPFMIPYQITHEDVVVLALA
jgi:hypothetical protein